MSERSESQDSPEIPPELQAKYDHWFALFKRRFPGESEEKLKRMAAEWACMNRKQRRKALKVSSPKLPRMMKVPRG